MGGGSAWSGSLPTCRAARPSLSTTRPRATGSRNASETTALSDPAFLVENSHHVRGGGNARFQALGAGRPGRLCRARLREPRLNLGAVVDGDLDHDGEDLVPRTPGGEMQIGYDVGQALGDVGAGTRS